MSVSEIKVFVYTLKETGQVIYVKRTRDMDFRVSWPELNVQVLSAEQVSGREFKVDGDPEMRAKLMIFLLLRSNLEYMKAEVRKTYSQESIAAAPIAGEVAGLFARMMRAEREIVLARIERFDQDFASKIGACVTGAQARAVYDHVQKTVDLGVFSAMNQERKNLYAESW